MQLVYKDFKSLSYFESEIKLLIRSILHYMIINKYVRAQDFKVPIDLTEEEQTEYKILHYFANKLTNFEILYNHPYHLRKIHELDHIDIRELGQKNYTNYMSSLTEDNAVLLKDEKSLYQKPIRIQELNIIYETLFKVQQDYVNGISDEIETEENRSRCRVEAEKTKNLIEKFSKDFDYIKILQNNSLKNSLFLRKSMNS